MGQEQEYEHTPHPDAEAPGAPEGTADPDTAGAEAAIENAGGDVTDGEPDGDDEA